MARKLRIQYPGAIYHVMNRGDHQETIFCDDDDRKLFVATLAEGCQKTALSPKRCGPMAWRRSRSPPGAKGIPSRCGWQSSSEPKPPSQSVGLPSG